MHTDTPTPFEVSPEFLKANGFSPTFPERFWAKVNKDGPLPDQTKYPGLEQCWVWTAYVKEDGYGVIGKGPGRKIICAHVASWILHTGTTPGELCVLHHCDNPACVRFSHLWRGTKKDNSDDMIRKGRAIHDKCCLGEQHGMSKLTSNQVLQIREAYATGQYTQREIGKIFSVAQTMVSLIVRRDNWTHI